MSPIGFLFLKLPPPPCAVLLVICHYGKPHRKDVKLVKVLPQNSGILLLPRSPAPPDLDCAYFTKSTAIGEVLPEAAAKVSAVLENQ